MQIRMYRHGSVDGTPQNHGCQIRPTDTDTDTDLFSSWARSVCTDWITPKCNEIGRDRSVPVSMNNAEIRYRMCCYRQRQNDTCLALHGEKQQLSTIMIC